MALVLSDWLQTCPIAANFSDTLVTLAATCEVGRGAATSKGLESELKVPGF